MSTLADRSIRALRANHDALAEQVRGLSPADLDRQSGSSEWDVAQVLSHLGSGAEIMLANLNGGIAGEGPPEQDFNVSVWDRWNATSQQEKSDNWLGASARLVAALEALDATTRTDLRVQLSFLPFPADLALLTGMRLNEAANHAWDVRVAFDAAASLTADEAGVLFDQYAGPLGFMVGFLGKPEALDGATVALAVEVPDGNLGVVLSDSVAIAGAPDNADATFSGPTEAFVRLLVGRLDADHTPADVAVSGAGVTLDQLRRVFPGM
ncbi:MAG: maleylpyruvate isomerase family mycothiol-dependent enzyme [bacterium]|nr:maleylpyruvate isomerase family mycothiol-dependent enzyme [bacterium]